MRQIMAGLLMTSLLASGLSLAGCSTSRPTQFYVLTPLSDVSDDAGELASGEHGPVVGVNRVKLPEYLNRPQIMTRTSHNALALAEFHQWGGSLQENFSSVLAANLSMLIPTDHIAVLPAKMTTRRDFEVRVDVIRFDRDSVGQVILNVRWHLVAGDANTTLAARTSRYRESAEGEGFEATVAAMNRALNKLSQEIGDEIAIAWRSKRP